MLSVYLAIILKVTTHKNFTIIWQCILSVLNFQNIEAFYPTEEENHVDIAFTN